MSTADSHREHWQSVARNTALRINLGWWLQVLSAPLVITAMAGAAALLLTRRQFSHVDPRLLAAYTAGGLALIGLICWLIARRRFERPAEALVRIEAAMHLHNALSAAEAGIVPWPAPKKRVDTGLAWHWPRLLVPLLGALAMLLAGFFLPVAAQRVAITTADQPQAWKQLEAELDHLKEEQVADEKYLEDTRKRLDELQAQPEEQWFSHSSLEATDSLKKSHRAETERVERELGRAEKALGDLEKNAGAMNQAQKNKLAEEFDQALQGLQNGAMKPNAQLLEQMKQLDLKDMANLTPEQMEQLREAMQKNRQGMKGAGKGEGEDWSDELNNGENGEGDGGGNGPGEGKDGDGPGGQGGVDRGPGHSPGVLGKEKDPLEIGKNEGLQAKDLSHATPGDLLELQDGEHQVDKTPSEISAGGNTDATGKGGDRVWRESLDPAEQNALKRFFK